MVQNTPQTIFWQLLFPLCNLKPQTDRFCTSVIIHEKTSSRENLAAILSNTVLKFNILALKLRQMQFFTIFFSFLGLFAINGLSV